MMKNEIVTKGKWEFDKKVADVFDDMLERSIPQYEIMRDTVFNLAKEFVRPYTHIVDLGCSRGKALLPFVNEFGDSNKYVGVEISKPMLTASRDCFKDKIKAGLVDILEMDLREEYPEVNSSVTLSVLTLQFLPINHRLQVLHNVYDGLISGGVFVLVEKILGSSYRIDEVFKTLYLQKKLDAGYGIEEIERKGLSLEGVLVPVTAKWNEDLLSMSNFGQIDCFWRWANFSGWVARKN